MPRASAKTTIRSRGSITKKRARKKAAARKSTAFAKKRAKRSVSSRRAASSRSNHIQDNEARIIGGSYSGGYRDGNQYGEQEGERHYRGASRPGLQGRYEEEAGGHYARSTGRYGRDEQGRYEEEDGGHYSRSPAMRSRGRPSQREYYESYDRDRRY